MAFPDSSKKAPNVFVSVADGTGSASSSSGTITANTTKVVNIIPTPPTPVPPIAEFSATPLSGIQPLLVQFTDLSLNSPTSWQWDFDNNGIVDSTLQNPQWTYVDEGIYSVKLTVSNGDGTDSVTKTSYITVTVPVGGCLLPSSIEDPDTIDLWHFDEGIGSPTIAPTLWYSGFPTAENLSGSFYLGPAETNCGTALYTGNQPGSSEIQLAAPPGLLLG